MFDPNKIKIIAGPCVAESYSLLEDTYGELSELLKNWDVQFFLKSSFDKANRNSIHSYRGEGLDKTLSWFSDLKEKYGCMLTTDIHESWQAEPVSNVVDLAQIPAYLCRQTDLIAAAATNFSKVSVKKGQFLIPENTNHILNKAKEANPNCELALMERGSTFGHGDLVVDMRGLKIMSQYCENVFFDITHSLQRPQAGEQTAGLRQMAPLMARSAAASGYVNGFFLEVHPNPKSAKCDSSTQLSFSQAKIVIEQVLKLAAESNKMIHSDGLFIN